jgi:hypothetical protein
VLAVFSTMVLLMTLAGALGLWEFNLRQMTDLGTGFWVWGLVSWVVSVFVGAFLSSVSSRSVDRRDGVIHGAVTWAAACVLGCLFLSYSMQGAEHVMSRGMLLGAFLGDLLALSAAILGGLLGSRSEVRADVSHAEAPVATRPFPVRATAVV